MADSARSRRTLYAASRECLGKGGKGSVPRVHLLFGELFPRPPPDLLPVWLGPLGGRGVLVSLLMVHLPFSAFWRLGWVRPGRRLSGRTGKASARGRAWLWPATRACGLDWVGFEAIRRRRHNTNTDPSHHRKND